MAQKFKQERTVIHLEMGDTHHYFGSVAAIYDYFSSNDIGISYGSLRNYGLNEGNPYKNAKCTIRKGALLSKASSSDSKRGIRK